MTGDEGYDESGWSQRSNMMVAQITSSYMTLDEDDHDDSDKMYWSQRNIHFL